MKRDRTFSVDFRHRRSGELAPVDFAQVARGLGCEASSVRTADELAPALRSALASGAPTVIHCTLARDPEHSAGINAGHWDLPKPAYLT